ncbi:hypothetical protein [Flavobacterium sp.]|uniref:hypothetical protein n=1 Tax=Flavobacterium sp. TaxID=239 RepID=UPI0026105E66|nr:hypothetical protein [Flavobacterium sp.]MDD3005256.1 hypothetical protein [Flavobacterium sp.]
MFKKISFIIGATLMYSGILAQEKMILKDGKEIPATEMWAFASDSYSYSGKVNVQIGKNDQSGILMLQVQVSDPQFKISGTVYLFLEDGNVITCTDKNLKVVDNKNIMAYYTLTPKEINAVKKKKITDVRFRIVGNPTQFSSPTGYFTAHNKIKSVGLADKTYDTQEAINQLFM